MLETTSAVANAWETRLWIANAIPSLAADYRNPMLEKISLLVFVQSAQKLPRMPCSVAPSEQL
jgi:hypothetical protein